MSDWLAMHGHAVYVWSAYAIFAVVIVADAFGPVLRRRRILSALRSRLKRESTRAARTAAPDSTP